MNIYVVLANSGQYSRRCVCVFSFILSVTALCEIGTIITPSL